AGGQPAGDGGQPTGGPDRAGGEPVGEQNRAADQDGRDRAEDGPGDADTLVQLAGGDVHLDHRDLAVPLDHRPQQAHAARYVDVQRPAPGADLVESGRPGVAGTDDRAVGQDDGDPARAGPVD